VAAQRTRMPIPMRARPESHPGTEAISKIPSAKLHQRTISTAVPQTAKLVTSTHQRATSLIPKQAKVGQTEPNSSSLLRKPSVRTNTTSNLRQITSAALQATKPKALVPVLASSASSKSDAGLRQPPLKPQFTAYQQHFSPKKPPRPESIASDTQYSVENTTTDHEGPEVGRLRDELLQLWLMHSGSQETLWRFESDVKLKLRSKFEALTKQNESILALEQHRNRCTSHTALRDWLDQDDEAISHKLLQLAICVRDLDSLTAKNGKYSSLMGQFQAWFEHMILALDSRKQPIETTSQNLIFVDPISSLWLQEVERIQWKLGSSRQILHDLGASDAGGIEFIMASYQALANNLHDELDTCVSIHKIALEHEDAWVRSSLQRLLDQEFSATQQAEATHRRGIWRTHATDSS
jgi:hypothetical protein